VGFFEGRGRTYEQKSRPLISESSQYSRERMGVARRNHARSLAGAAFQTLPASAERKETSDACTSNPGVNASGSAWKGHCRSLGKIKKMHRHDDAEGWMPISSESCCSSRPENPSKGLTEHSSSPPSENNVSRRLAAAPVLPPGSSSHLLRIH